MKTHTLASSIAAVVLAVPFMVNAQQSSTSQPGTQPSASSSSQTSASSTQMGIIIQGGTTFVVRNGQATRLDSSALQSGQMMTSEGQATWIPSNVSGIEGFTASPSATTDTTAAAPSGVTVHNGVTYLIRNGQATKLDTTTLPSGQMMTFEGQLTAQPQNIQGLQGTSSSSSTQPSARDLAPGRSGNPPPGQGGIVPGQGKRDTDAATSPSTPSSERSADTPRSSRSDNPGKDR